MTDDGKKGFTAGSTQIAKLTVEKIVMEKIASATTYKCAVTSGKYANYGNLKLQL